MPVEKAEIMRCRANTGLEPPGVERTPNVCGGEACLMGTRIPVWVLVRARQLGSSKSKLLDAYPSLCAEDLRNAWAYYDGHREEINRLVEESEKGQ